MRRLGFVFLFVFSSLTYSVDKPATGTFYFDFRALPLDMFLDLTNLYTGKTIIPAPDLVKTDINYYSNANYSASDFDYLFNKILTEHGYQVSTSNGILTVENQKNISQVFKPKYIKAEAVAFILKEQNTELFISFNAKSNVVSVSGLPEHVSNAIELSRLMDIKRDQVKLEVIISEVGSDFIADVGLDWGFNAGNVLDLIGLIDDITYLSDFSALLSFLESNTAVDVLSSPSVVVLDNETAILTVGDEVPFVTETSTDDGGQTTTQIQRKDVGLKLEITPHIIDNKHVELDIYQEISSVNETSTEYEASDLVTSKRDIETVVYVRINEMLGLGGLKQSSKTEIDNKLSVLSDIPIIGGLFKSNETQTSSNNLLIFIKVQVM